MHTYAFAVNVQGTKSMNEITDPFTLCASCAPPFRDSPFTLILASRVHSALESRSHVSTFIYNQKLIGELHIEIITFHMCLSPNIS
jgi:hypothetical protein